MRKQGCTLSRAQSWQDLLGNATTAGRDRGRLPTAQAGAQMGWAHADIYRIINSIISIES